jgi:hypothetical protein
MRPTKKRVRRWEKVIWLTSSQLHAQDTRVHGMRRSSEAALVLIVWECLLSDWIFVLDTNHQRF